MKRRRFLAVGMIVLLLCNLLAACAKPESSLEEWEKAEIKRVKSSVGSGMYYDAQGRHFQLIDEGLFENRWSCTIGRRDRRSAWKDWMLFRKLMKSMERKCNS